MRALLPVLLISIALASGCVGQIPGLPAIPGLDVVKPSRTTSVVGVADVVLIESIRTLPEQSALTNDVVRLFANIVSRETDPRRDVMSVMVDLFDATTFKTSSGEAFCNAPDVVAVRKQGGSRTCEPNQCSLAAPCTLRAGEVKSLQWTLKAPSEQDIAGIVTRGALNFYGRYDYSSSTNYEMLVVTMDEILRLQQQGDTLSVPVSDLRTGGPVQVEISSPTPFAVASGPDTSQDAFIVVKVRNVGSGTVLSKDIENKPFKLAAGSLKIRIPGFFSGLIEPPGFTCQQSSDGLAAECTNTEALDIIRKESIPYQFVLKTVMPLDGGVPFRSFLLTAEVSYRYELRGRADLEVRPPFTGA
jgi:hypothetical protein